MHVDDVLFDPSDMYMAQTDGLAKRAEIARLTVAKAPVGTYSAIVVNGWHKSRSDTKEHCTVDYYTYNERFEKARDHVHRPDVAANEPSTQSECIQ
jgi:hypothetical protein